MRKTTTINLGPFGGLLFGLLFAVVGYFVAFTFGKPILNNAAASRDWPSVRGEISRSRVSTSRSKDKTTYRADIEYRYRHEGRDLIGNNVFFGDQMNSSSAASANRVVGRYPHGAQVDVYFDPAEPGNSVLEPGTRWQSYLVFGIGLAFLVAGVLVVGGSLIHLLVAGAILGGIAAAWFGTARRDSAGEGAAVKRQTLDPARLPYPRANAGRENEDDGFHLH